MGFSELGLYIFALFLLFLTPGPVWVALIARCLQHGFFAGLALALGVVVGDVIWPIVALLTLDSAAALQTEILFYLRYVAVAVFVGLGVSLLRATPPELTPVRSPTRRGFAPNFAAGFAVIIGNPKAILFYVGILPGFFDVAALSTADIISIGLVSALVPFVGNVSLAYALQHATNLLASTTARRRLNQATGGVLLLVAGVILVG